VYGVDPFPLVIREYDLVVSASASLLPVMGGGASTPGAAW
jgi:hypothetical protein